MQPIGDSNSLQIATPELSEAAGPICIIYRGQTKYYSTETLPSSGHGALHNKPFPLYPATIWRLWRAARTTGSPILDLKPIRCLTVNDWSTLAWKPRKNWVVEKRVFKYDAIRLSAVYILIQNLKRFLTFVVALVPRIGICDEESNNLLNILYLSFLCESPSDSVLEDV